MGSKNMMDLLNAIFWVPSSKAMQKSRICICSSQCKGQDFENGAIKQKSEHLTGNCWQRLSSNVAVPSGLGCRDLPLGRCPTRHHTAQHHKLSLKTLTECEAMLSSGNPAKEALPTTMSCKCCLLAAAAAAAASWQGCAEEGQTPADAVLLAIVNRQRKNFPLMSVT